LFEIGKKFLVQGAEPVRGVESGAGQGGELREIETLAGIATGARWPEQWGSPRDALDFYDVKADLQGVLALTGGIAGGV
jgi:phenylalanyl-tRNA synthetase beta chain